MADILVGGSLMDVENREGKTLTIGNKSIHVIKGDLTETSADALVNAANNHLWMGGGVAGALSRKGGPTIEKEAMLKGPIPPGSSIHTDAGDLRARWIIHAAVMDQDLRTSPDLVMRAAGSAVRTAIDLGARNLAFPALGCGVGGLPYRVSAHAMRKGIEAGATGAACDLEVILVLHGREAYETFRSVFSLQRAL